MHPEFALLIVLVLACTLVLLSFLAGVEIGKALKLRQHPGYEPRKSGNTAVAWPVPNV
jgi:hypothetical protein